MNQFEPEDPFYRPRPRRPLDLPSTEFILFDQRPLGGGGGSSGNASAVQIPHAFQPSFTGSGITITSGYVNSIPVTGADGTTVWSVGSAYKYYVEVTTGTDGLATAAEMKRTTGTIPTHTATAGFQILFEVDATGRVTSQHATSSLAHQMCGEEMHLFGGLG